MIDEILTPWRVNNHVNLLLFDHIGDEGMHCTLRQPRAHPECAREACFAEATWPSRGEDLGRDLGLGPPLSRMPDMSWIARAAAWR